MIRPSNISSFYGIFANFFLPLRPSVLLILPLSRHEEISSVRSLFAFDSRCMRDSIAHLSFFLFFFLFFFYKLDDSTRAVSIRETLDEAQNGRITRPIGSLGYTRNGFIHRYEYPILARISRDELFPEKIWMSWMVVGPPRGTVSSRPWRTFEIAS